MSPIAMPQQGPDRPIRTVQPHHLPDRQDYAVAQERQRHNQALYSLGEYAVFVLRWGLQDLAEGRVTRCARCYGGDVISTVYNQALSAKCPVCYGTTFQGGVKAMVVRPSIWDSNEEDFRASARGQVITQTTTVQSTSDFRMRTGDYIFRSDGSRYQVKTLSSNGLRTGFATDNGEVVGYNYGTVAREDESSVAYLIPPSNSVLRNRLTLSSPHTPREFDDLEIINGPLILEIPDR